MRNMRRWRSEPNPGGGDRQQGVYRTETTHGEIFDDRTVLLGVAAGAHAQTPNVRIGEAVPRDVPRTLNDRAAIPGARRRTKATGRERSRGPGLTGMGLMVFLASGEDPNFGV